jgi:hypothetical protein
MPNCNNQLHISFTSLHYIITGGSVRYPLRDRSYVILQLYMSTCTDIDIYTYCTSIHDIFINIRWYRCRCSSLMLMRMQNSSSSSVILKESTSTSERVRSNFNCQFHVDIQFEMIVIAPRSENCCDQQASPFESIDSRTRRRRTDRRQNEYCTLVSTKSTPLSALIVAFVAC